MSLIRQKSLMRQKQQAREDEKRTFNHLVTSLQNRICRSVVFMQTTHVEEIPMVIDLPDHDDIVTALLGKLNGETDDHAEWELESLFNYVSNHSYQHKHPGTLTNYGCLANLIGGRVLPAISEVIVMNKHNNRL